MESRLSVPGDGRRYPIRQMDAIFTIIVLAAFAIMPFVISAAFVVLAMYFFRLYEVSTDRWFILPLFLIGFAATCFGVSALTLTYQPENKPGLMNPVLVLLVLDGLLLLPVAVFAMVRGLLMLGVRRLEAGLNMLSATMYGMLYYPFLALRDYYPHV